MKVKVKSATPKDLVAILALNHQLCIKESREFDATINSDYPMQKLGEDYFKGRIKDGCVLVASVGNKTVGYLAGTIIPTEDYRNVSRLAEAENMFVLEEYRSLGIGKQLFGEFIKWCKSRRVARIRAVASAENLRGIGFYRREGLTDYSLVLEKKL